MEDAHLLGCQDWFLPGAALLQAPQQHQFASQSQLQHQPSEKVQDLSRAAALLQLCLFAAAAAVALFASSLHPAAAVALLLQPTTAIISMLQSQHIRLHLLQQGLQSGLYPRYSCMCYPTSNHIETNYDAPNSALHILVPTKG